MFLCHSSGYIFIFLSFYIIIYEMRKKIFHSKILLLLFCFHLLFVFCLVSRNKIEHQIFKNFIIGFGLTMIIIFSSFYKETQITFSSNQIALRGVCVERQCKRNLPLKMTREKSVDEIEDIGREVWLRKDI